MSLPVGGRDQEGGLEGVLGVVGVVQHAAADAQHHRPVPVQQGREGFLISAAGEPVQEVRVGPVSVGSGDPPEEAEYRAGVAAHAVVPRVSSRHSDRYCPELGGGFDFSVWAGPRAGE